MVTYGDGVCDVDLTTLLEFHRSHGSSRLSPRSVRRRGSADLIFDGDLVSEFTEKPQIGEGWINGGFSFSSPAFSIIWTTTIAVWKQMLSSDSPRMGQLAPIVTRASGNAWTRCAISACWRILERAPCSLESVGMSEELKPKTNNFWRDRPTFVTGGTGLLGGWLVAPAG